MRALALSCVLTIVACDSESKAPPSLSMREAFAQEMQDRLRDRGGGYETTVATETEDSSVLVIGMSGCSRAALETIVAAPRMQRELKDLGFWKVRCRDSDDRVTAPWKR